MIRNDVGLAKSLYASTRAPYERVEPVAESFGDLDAAIDARADDTPVEDITGFHRIEHALWVNNTTAGMGDVARKLMVDVVSLRDKAASLDLDVTTIANGATELLGEVSKSKVTGEEERYSHTDLWDFEANVSGAKQAVDSVRPLLRGADESLARTIDERFVTVDSELRPHRTGALWKSYTELTPEQVRRLSQAIDALAEPVSEVAGKVSSGR